MPPHNDHHRQVGVTALTILPDGSLRPIFPAHDPGVGTPGVTHLTLDAYAPRREAAEFQIRRYAAGQKGLSGEYQMQMKDGSYLQFNSVDFGNGAAAFRVEISSENKILRDTVLQVRLNNPAGKVIGTVQVEGGRGVTVYRTYTVPINASAQGVHDLFLLAHGEGGGAHGNLFNITWFAFVKRQP
jgi:hypothetical protein